MKNAEACPRGQKRFLGKCIPVKDIDYSKATQRVTADTLKINDFIIGGNPSERAKWYDKTYESNLRSGSLYKILKVNPKSFVVIEASAEGWNEEQKARLSKEGWHGEELMATKLLVNKLPQDYKKVLKSK